MSCDNKPQPPSPLSILAEARILVTGLTAESSAEEVDNLYMDYRMALFDALTADIDRVRFDVAWRMITYADPVVDQILSKSPDSEGYGKLVERVKELVEESYRMAPWA